MAVSIREPCVEPLAEVLASGGMNESDDVATLIHRYQTSTGGDNGFYAGSFVRVKSCVLLPRRKRVTEF